MKSVRLLSPEEVAKLLLQRLPNGGSVFLWNLWTTISWFTLPVAFVSQLSDLVVVVSWLERTRHALDFLAPALVPLGDFLISVARWWQTVTEPVRELAARVLPASEKWLPDTAMMASIALPSLIRLARITESVRSFSQTADLESGKRLADIVHREEDAALDGYLSDARRIEYGRRAVRSSIALASFAALLTVIGLVLVSVDEGWIG